MGGLSWHGGVVPMGGREGYFGGGRVAARCMDWDPRCLLYTVYFGEVAAAGWLLI